MTMVAHRMGPILGLITALLVSSICMKNTEAQQSAAGIPSGVAKKTANRSDTVSGSRFHRRYLDARQAHRRLVGLRTKLANNGVQLDMDNVHTFQSVSGGGVDSTSRYLGNAEIVLKLDAQKMGL